MCVCVCGEQGLLSESGGVMKLVCLFGCGELKGGGERVGT